MYAEHIKKLRKKQKLSQKKLAEMTGLSTSYIQQLETGAKTNPSLESLSKLSKALNDTEGLLIQLSSMDILNDVKEIINKFDRNEVTCLKPLCKHELIENFRNMAYSVPGMYGYVEKLTDDAIYVIMHSPEFLMMLDLLNVKYRDVKLSEQK